jgi:hypothetical protein
VWWCGRLSAPAACDNHRPRLTPGPDRPRPTIALRPPRPVQPPVSRLAQSSTSARLSPRMGGGSDGHRGCFCANAAFRGSLTLAASCSPPLDARQSLPRGGRRACSYRAERWACERRGLAQVPLGQAAHGHRGAWRSRSRGLRWRLSCLARSTRSSPITTGRARLRGRAAGHANEYPRPGSNWAPGKGAK